ncbi:MAG: PilZ domain-containing protein [Candidatus Omnitrophica bacterium]|nr:PilZ domain-containing protein [Candidatus Omnitrophota bacterium]
MLIFYKGNVSHGFSLNKRELMIIKEENKRRFPRLNLHAPLRYQIRGDPHFDNAVSDNVSVGGLSFTTDAFLAPDTKVMLEFNVLSRVLHTIGRITWASPLPHSYRNRLGVEFLEVAEEDQKYLTDYIDTRLSQA